MDLQLFAQKYSQMLIFLTLTHIFANLLLTS